MATQTLATADAILKDLYVGPIVEQLNQKTYMLDQIERDADHIDHTGRRAIVPLHTNRNRGRGSRGDNSNLPVAGKQSYADAIIPIRYHYSAIEVTDPAIQAATGDNQGAFLNVLEAESKGVAQDLKKDINRQVYGDGTGLMAGVRASSTSTTVNVDQGVKYIGIGDPVDVLQISTGTVAGNGVAGAIVTARTTGATPTLTIDTALAGTATTAYGVYLAGSYGVEMDGLRNITNDDRTLHGINSATAGNEYWDGQEQSVSSVTASEDAFIQLADKVAATGLGEVDVFLTTRGIKRRLANTYQSQKRFNDANAVKVHGGYTAIMVNEIPVVADDDCPVGFAFGLDKSAFRWFEQAKPGWLEARDSGVFHLKDGTVAGVKQNVWQAYFRWYAALACTSPNRTGRIPDAADDNAT